MTPLETAKVNILLLFSVKTNVRLLKPLLSLLNANTEVASVVAVAFLVVVVVALVVEVSLEVSSVALPAELVVVSLTPSLVLPTHSLVVRWTWWWWWFQISCLRWIWWWTNSRTSQYR